MLLPVCLRFRTYNMKWIHVHCNRNITKVSYYYTHNNVILFADLTYWNQSDDKAEKLNKKSKYKKAKGWELSKLQKLVFEPFVYYIYNKICSNIKS